MLPPPTIGMARIRRISKVCKIYVSAEHHASKSALCQFYTRFKVYLENAWHQGQSPLEVLLVDVCWDDNLDVASL